MKEYGKDVYIVYVQVPWEGMEERMGKILGLRDSRSLMLY